MLAPVTESVALLPAQMAVGVLTGTRVGKGTPIMVMVFCPTQDKLLVPNNVKVVVALITGLIADKVDPPGNQV